VARVQQPAGKYMPNDCGFQGFRRTASTLARLSQITYTLSWLQRVTCAEKIGRCNQFPAWSEA
jgi:hypothetical protein